MAWLWRYAQWCSSTQDEKSQSVEEAAGKVEASSNWKGISVKKTQIIGNMMTQ